MAKNRIFLDSDVIVSSLLSTTGASFWLVNQSKDRIYISQAVLTEVKSTLSKLNLPTSKIETLKSINIVVLGLSKPRVAEEYIPYVTDPHDSHVVAGAHKTKSGYLLTHNQKHFRSQLIKQELGINVLKPGKYLQFIRSKVHDPIPPHRPRSN